MARRKAGLAETTVNDVVETTIIGKEMERENGAEIGECIDSLGLEPIVREEMTRESGITREPSRNKKVTWLGRGKIGIAGYGDLDPGQSINLPVAIANDLARAPGFSIED